jgi:photosystem II stability/assembly factor-like uncharacterized protein
MGQNNYAPGITILVHGFCPSGDSETQIGGYWKIPFITSIIDKYSGGEVYLYNRNSAKFILQNSEGDLIYDVDSSGEKILVFDWGISSNNDESGHAEAAGEALFVALINSGFLSITNPTSNKSFHFISHSRGTVVTSEVVQRMGVYNIPVNYVTYLDPHDFAEGTVPFDGVFHDPAVQLWSNINYADNFYQQANNLIVPSGRSLEQLLASFNYNRALDNLYGFREGDNYDFDIRDPFKTTHGLVIDYYEGTIVLNKPSSWYEGCTTGFQLWLNRGGHNYNGKTNGFNSPYTKTNPKTLDYLVPDYYDNFDNNEESPYFFNGKFNLKDATSFGNDVLAGWSYFGGGGTGELTGNEDNKHLTLNFNDASRTHNWFYVAPNANGLKFYYKVENAGTTELLKVSLKTIGGENGREYYFSLEELTDWMPVTINLSNFRDKIIQVSFEIDGGAIVNSTVLIDDISIELPDITPTITLSSPNGGEILIVNKTNTITWNCQGVTNVNIEFSTNNGVSWEEIAFNVPAYKKSFDYSFNVLSIYCKIRIKDSSDPNVFDVSEQCFTSIDSYWSAQSSGTTQWLWDVAFTNTNNGIVVGWNGTILKTTNGGTNWIAQTSGTTQQLQSVSFADANNGIAVGSAILKTTDGGTTWSIPVNSVDNLLYSISFPDINNATAVGANGAIIKTTDGGLTWSSQVSGTTAYLRSVSFTNANTGTAVGYNGTILRTLNGGATWVQQNSGTSSYLKGVSFSDANNGTSVGEYSVNLRTTNGGTTWVQQSSEGGNFNSVHFTDSNNGTIVGYNGKILRTNNGGLTWFAQTSGTGDLYKVFFSDSNTGTAVGFSGNIGDVSTIIRTSNGALPVELTLFNGQWSGNNIRLNWKTATEVNNYGFEVERKTNNTSWRKIGFVSGHGNSNSPKEYNFVDSDILNDKVLYRLKQIDFDGKYEYSKEILINIEAPKSFSLSQNFPNPFNPSTKIKYSISTTCFVKLKIYDILGRELLTLVNEQQNPGSYENIFNGTKYSSGIYFYELQAGDYLERKKLTFIK